MKRLSALAVTLAFMGAPPAFSDEAKREACAAAPTHACVLDLLWDEMVRVPRDYLAETKRAFIDAVLLTDDKALIDLYMQRTEWRNADALNSSRISIARRKGDSATLIEHADKAIRGLRYDWYQLYDIATGLAESGELERARKVADLIPHGGDDSVTPLNLYQRAQDVIAFNDRAPITFAGWADKIAEGDGWWGEEDITWLKSAAARAGDLSSFPQELQDRYRADGWKYLRALARLAPEMTVSGEAGANLFRSYVESWADPRKDEIAELILAIAMRAGPDARTAMLAAFDARQPSPSGRIARMRVLADDPDTLLSTSDRGMLGLVHGPFEQAQAARALGTYSHAEFIEKARAGEGLFNLSRPAVLRAALQQTDDAAFALEIATLMAELGEPRTSDGYDYARHATEWALDHCQAELFTLAESRLARRDSLDTMMRSARFTHDPVSIVQYIAYDDRISTDVAYALRGYQAIIENGYCPAKQPG
ncbi:MAG: hypothetical protein R3C46_03480 [Hyphomonadaceae bacterium]